MPERKTQLLADAADLIDRRWKWLVVLAWLLLSAWYLWGRLPNIQAFVLNDTDDNMRMAQVRALLNGQDWFDLAQHKLAGWNIHWSRLVDLPLAGIILALRPFIGGRLAEQVAIGVAPLIPLLPLLFAMALTARRLVDRMSYPLVFLAMLTAGSAVAQFLPTRIDHHGWQLAMLAVAVAGVADPKRARGGATTGIATALSLSIGLELLIYLALLGAAQVLFWIDDAAQKRRMAAYGVTTAGGTALGFLVFASYANRAPVCDALSPVWLSDALVGGALLFVLAALTPGDWKRRLALAAAAGVAIAAFHALAWPHCLSRLEGVSPEVQQLWLNNVREARPLYRHAGRTALLIVALPLTAILGWALLLWRARGERDLLRRTLAVAVPALAATILLLWQTRTGPASQMMNIIGAIAMVWILAPLTLAAKNGIVRIVGPVLVIVAGLGALMPVLLTSFPDKASTPRDRAIGRANGGCNMMSSYKPIAKLPAGMVFTFVDLGPRLIAVTHHRAVTGPYHRNGEQIGDVMRTFRGTPEAARATIAKYRADYLLICPDSSTTTIFMADAPKGFYAQLKANKVPDWLEPVPLSAKSPFRMWKVRR